MLANYFERSMRDGKKNPIKSRIITFNVIVITFYSPSCWETAKRPFGLGVKLPPAHLSTTHDGGFTPPANRVLRTGLWIISIASRSHTK